MSEYGNDDDIKSMLEYFDASTKPVFKNENEASYIKFGSMKCNDPSCNIKRGQLMLTGCAHYGLDNTLRTRGLTLLHSSDMVSFFQPSLDAIVDAIHKQRAAVSCSLSVSRPISPQCYDLTNHLNGDQDRLPCGWLCSEPLALLLSQRQAQRSWPDSLPAGLAHVRDAAVMRDLVWISD